MSESRVVKLPPGVRRLFRLPFRTLARVVRDVDDEVAFHLDRRTEELTAAGLAAAEARAEALRRFGDVDDLRAFCRAQARPVVLRSRVREWLTDLGQDLRFAGRQLRRSPGFVAVAVVTIGLGIGATTTIYCAVHDILLKPLPYRDADRLVAVDELAFHGQASMMPTWAVVDAWRSRSRDLEGIVALTRTVRTLGGAGEPELVGCKALEPVFIPFLGSRPVIGRAFIQDDARPDAPPVALLGETLWRRRLGASRSALGREITLDGRPYTIVGVMPRDFGVALFPDSDQPQVFVPLLPEAGTRRVGALGRLRKGVTADQAARELGAIPASDPAVGARDSVSANVVMVRDDFVHWYRSTLTLLMGAVGLVLLIACANVANLLLVRAWSRQREFGIRTAIGAGRGRLARQVLTESVLIGIAGGALGALLAWRGIPLLASLRPSFGHLEVLAQVRLDLPVLAFTAAVAMLVGVVFGLAPALLAADRSVGETLKGTERTTSGGPGARRLRGVLVVGEIAISIVLLISAGLLVRSLTARARADQGLFPAGLLAVNLELPADHYPSPGVRAAVLAQVVERVRGVAGVEAASAAFQSPWDAGRTFVQGFAVQGREAVPGAGPVDLDFNNGSPDFLRTAEIPLIEGHVFAADTNAREIVVSRAFARRYLPAGAWLGARVRLGQDSPWLTVVGVVSDQRHPGEQGAPPEPAFYGPLGGSGIFRTVLVRGASPAALLPFVARSIMAMDPAIHVYSAKTTSMALADRRSEPRFLSTLLGSFAVLAVVLAAVGLYGVVSYSVRLRTKEIGVRVALGASAGNVVVLVLRHSLALILPGVVLGLAGAAAATRLIRSRLYGMGPLDPITFVSAAAVLVIVALVASVVPARAAVRVDPVEALRAE